MRLFFGSEFCEALLPSRPSLLEACRRGRQEHEGFTYVAPPAGDTTLRKLRAHFELLAAEGGPIEVVANDWGVLRLVREVSSGLTPVLGRLMNKMLRDPRITPRLGASGLPEAAIQAVRQSSLTAPPFAALLRCHGVETVELDNLYQGIDIAFARLGLRPSLHVPFGLVASGPACFFAGMHQRKQFKFSNDTPCQFECRTLIGEMRDPNADRRSPPLVTQGNTVFYRQDRETIERGLAWAEFNGARVVVRSTPFGDGFATDDVALARRWLEEHV